MKLYYSPGACALGVQIAMREAGMKFDMVKVDLAAKTSAEGDYRQANPKGYVPAVMSDGGELWTEGAIILQRLADSVPDKNLIPKFGTPERYRAMEWLHFVATELHKGFSGLFNKTFNEEARESMKSRLQLRFAVIDAQLQKTPFMLGSQFSVVDAYLYNILRWAGPLKVDLTAHKGIMGFMEKMATRPAVRAAVEAEGLKL